MSGKIIAAAVVLIAGAVFADHEELFGVREERTPDFIHVTLQFVDAETRAPVSDVHVACTRPMQLSACSERRGPRVGETTLMFGVLKRTRRTRLFSEEVGYTFGDVGGMRLLFIHPRYERSKMDFGDDAVMLAGTRNPVVELTRTVD